MLIFLKWAEPLDVLVPPLMSGELRYGIFYINTVFILAMGPAVYPMEIGCAVSCESMPACTILCIRIAAAHSALGNLFLDMDMAMDPGGGGCLYNCPSIIP